MEGLTRCASGLILLLLVGCKANVLQPDSRQATDDSFATPALVNEDVKSGSDDDDARIKHETGEQQTFVPKLKSVPAPVMVSVEDAEDTSASDERKAFASVQREAYFNEAFSNERRSSHRGDGTCQYTFHVAKGPHCYTRSTEMKLYEMQQTLSIVQLQMQNQRRRLDATESFLRRFRHVVMRRESRSGNIPTSSEVSDSQSQSVNYFTNGPSKALESLSEEMQVQLSNLEIQIDDAESKRMRLQLRNLNLTRLAQRKQRIINNLTQENNNLVETVSQLQSRLKTMEEEKIAMLNQQQTLSSQKSNLEEERRTMLRRISSFSLENKRLERETETLRSQVELLRTEKQHDEKLLADATSRIAELTSSLTSTDGDISAGNGSSICNSSTEQTFNENHIEDEEIKYTRCGVLINISAPETISQSQDEILHRAGVWMRDPLGPAGSKKVWVINQIGVKMKELYQYANLDDFRKNKPQIIHTLPVPTESNGAVVYNGSLFFQRRNSRHIVRYDIGTDHPLKDRSLRRAGFHGMFAYTWGGHTDIDFAVDETGLWVIYSTPKSRGKMLITKINPKTLRPVRTIRTPIPKQKVANAFIICQTLYTVSDFKTRKLSINFSFNLKTRKFKRMNIPLISNYLFMTMIDYNPRDRYLYVWDNGRRVRYRVTLDDSIGWIRNGRIFPGNATTT